MIARLRPLVAALLVGLLAATAAAGERPLTVVELYTSQGCSSCPPADAYLGELAGRDDIVALSMHVDYWDYIGWKDPFASADITRRQRVYARHLGMGYVYTPQMVVQGMAHTTGSNRRDVERLITSLAGAKRLDVGLARGPAGLEIAIPGGTFADETARVLVAAFDARHETDVRRGENAGRVLVYSNVVRDLVEVATWSGAAIEITVPAAEIDITGRDGCAVLVQSVETGRILGAARIALTPKS